MERFVEGILALSGTITTLTVFLIILFLFSEGFGVFNTSPLEHHNTLLVNRKNPVNHLKAEEIKNIYDANFTHWNSLGGPPDSIILVSVNNLTDFVSEEDLGADFEFLPRRMYLEDVADDQFSFQAPRC